MGIVNGGLPHMARVYGRGELVWEGNNLRLGRGRKLSEIVQDSKYPNMWRVRHPNGSLSDMVNRTRAKDAAVTVAIMILNGQETPAEAA
jgi:hypothetical protein